MISKEKIKKNAICYWSAENESFVAESALIPNIVIGIGDTTDEAFSTFYQALDDMFDEVVADNVAGYSKGRPSKGYVPFNANVRPTSKAKLSELSEQLDVSQGETVDFLVFFHDRKLQETVPVLQKDQVVEALAKLAQQQAELVKEQHETRKAILKAMQEQSKALGQSNPVLSMLSASDPGWMSKIQNSLLSAFNAHVNNMLMPSGGGLPGMQPVSRDKMHMLRAQ